MVILREADKAAISQKTEISIVIIEMRKGVEGDAVHGDKGGGGKQRLFIKGDPMNAVVIRHDALNYPPPLYPPLLLYFWDGDCNN
jgi:hypothetical protein